MTAPAIEQHPDIAALRDRYDRAAETPTAQLVEGLTPDNTAITSNVIAGALVALFGLGTLTMGMRRRM